MRVHFMLFSGLPEGMPARRNPAQLGYDAVRGFVFTGVFGDSELGLHTKPLHGGRFVLSGKSLTLFAITRKTHSRASLKPI